MALYWSDLSPTNLETPNAKVFYIAVIIARTAIPRFFALHSLTMLC